MPDDWDHPMSNDMQEIIPGLFLGPYNAATKSKFNNLLLHGITHIICIRHGNEVTFIKPYFPEKFIYLTIEMADCFTQTIIPHIMKCKDFIDQCLRNSGRCLVLSCMGVSRSPSVVIAYIMGKKGLIFEEAMEYVKRIRFCVFPNSHFVQQLKEYEMIYRAEQTALMGQCSRENGKFKRKFTNSEEDEGAAQYFSDKLEYMIS